MEVAVHPPARRFPGGRRAAVGVLFQQRTALHEAVHGEFVERVPGARAVRGRGRQQVVDQREGVRGVRALTPYGGRRGRLHDLLQAGVDGAEERTEPTGLGGRQLGAVPVQAVHPGVQGIAPAVDDGHRVTVRVRERRGDGDAQRVQLLGRAVLTDDGGVVTAGVVEVVLVEVMLEEVRPAGGRDPVTVVQQSLGERLAGEGLTGPGVAAQHLADRRNRWKSHR